MLPSIVGIESDDAEGNKAGCTTHNPDEGGEAVDLAYDLVLFLFFVIVSIVEKELILFVASDLSTIGKEQQEADCDHCPDDEHGGQCAERICHVYLFPWAGLPCKAEVVYRAGPLVSGLGGHASVAGIIRLQKWIEPAFSRGVTG